MSGQWRSCFCAVCGKRNDRHLSYGRDIAARLGGDPLDYVAADLAPVLGMKV